MLANALVGHTGFVGSNLLRQRPFEACFNSSNIQDIGGQGYDLLVFAGAQAKKWWANDNPQADRAGIERAVAALRGVRAQRAVLISTVDVIPAGIDAADETVDCEQAATHPYGAHRFWLEQEFRARYPDCLVVRLPGLFGPGLKKNVIFDLLTGNQCEKINRLSQFQYYDLARLWSDIEIALRERLGLVHLFTEPVATQTIIERCFPDVEVGAEAGPFASYDFRTRHGRLFGGDDRYIEAADSVMRRLADFVAAARKSGTP